MTNTTPYHCYDCGQADWGPFGDGLVRCNHCAELVYPAERIGRVRAFVRRIAYKLGHHNTQGARS
jgi:hypothetical protein